jgi:hypothetical protein
LSTRDADSVTSCRALALGVRPPSLHALLGLPASRRELTAVALTFPFYPWPPDSSALAGALAAVLANAAIYPLDTVKTRLQAADADDASGHQLALELEGPASSTANEDASEKADQAPLSSEQQASSDRKLSVGRSQRRPAFGLVGSLGRILAEEGVSGFYRGFLANMLNTFSMRVFRSLLLDRSGLGYPHEWTSGTLPAVG